MKVLKEHKGKALGQIRLLELRVFVRASFTSLSFQMQKSGI